MIARNMMTEYDDTEYDDTEYEDPQPSSPPPQKFSGGTQKKFVDSQKIIAISVFFDKKSNKKSGGTQNFCGEFLIFLTKIRNKIWG